VVGELTWQRRLFGLWLPLGALTVFCLLPFAWMVITSLKPNAELYDPKAFPLAIRHPSLEHYIGLLKETNFLLWTANTMLVAVIATAISLVLGTMLAYPLARLRFPGAALLAMAVGAAYLVPQTLLFVPMVDLVNRLELGNTLSAVVLTYPTLLVPFCAWLLLGYFKTVPKELEEAALIDGASRWRAMTRIVLPLCVPGFISAGIFAFTLAQNEFLYALLFLTRSNIRTVSIGVVGELIRGDAFYWGQLMAASFLGLIPVVLIYLFFVKYYVAGLTAGSVKG
jgi:multiple sugar transport system permease protein